MEGDGYLYYFSVIRGDLRYKYYGYSYEWRSKELAD